VAAQIPFFDRIIMPIGSCGDSKELFKWYYGISIDQTLELIKEEKIIPILKFTPDYYENANFLDPILEKKPPCEAIRNSFIDYYAYSKQDYVKYKGELTSLALGFKEEFLNESIDLLRKGSKSELDKMFWMIINLHIFRDNPIKSYNVPAIFSSAYSQLKAAGYDNLVKGLLEYPHLSDTFAGVCAYSSILYSSPRESLGGIQSWSPQEVVISKYLSSKGIRSFENEVGKKLIEFKLHDFIFISIDEIIKGSKTKESFRARETLKVLNRAIETEKEEDLVDLSKDVQKSWENVSNTIRSALDFRSKLKLKIKKNVIPLTLGICGGVAASHLGLHGIIGHIGGEITGHIAGELIKPSSSLEVKLLELNHLVVVPGGLDIQQRMATSFYFKGKK